MCPEYQYQTEIHYKHHYTEQQPLLIFALLYKGIQIEQNYFFNNLSKINSFSVKQYVQVTIIHFSSEKQ